MQRLNTHRNLPLTIMVQIAFACTSALLTIAVSLSAQGRDGGLANLNPLSDAELREILREIGPPVGAAEQLPANLFDPYDPQSLLPEDPARPGTIIRTRHDLLLARGPNWQGEPPPTTARFNTSAGEPIDHIPAWNNRAIDQIVHGGFDQRRTLNRLYDDFESAARADPRYLPVVYNAGRLALLLGKPSDARHYFRRAEQLVPEFAGTTINLGRAHAALGHEREAILAHQRAHAQLFPGEEAALFDSDFPPEVTAGGAEPLPLFRARPMLELGYHFEKAGDPHRAAAYYREILRYQRDSLPARLGLARLALARSDDSAPAAWRMLEAIEINPSDNWQERHNGRFEHEELELLSLRAKLAEQLALHEEAATDLEAMLRYPHHPWFLTHSRRHIEQRLEKIRSRR